MIFWSTLGASNVSESSTREMSAMLYTLWDTETNNLVAEYDSEREALELVLSGIERNGPQDTDTLTLQAEDERGEIATIAWGKELAERAHQALDAVRNMG